DDSKMVEYKNALKGLLDIKDMGKINKFLGVVFADAHDGKALAMSQQEYIEKMYKQFGLEQACQVTKLPQLDTIDLSNDPVDSHLKETGDFRTIIGSLLFVANMTRPDTSTAVSLLSRFLDRPTKRAMRYAKTIVRYLKATKEKCLMLGQLCDKPSQMKKVDESNLVAYSDANYAPEGDRKSQSGLVIRLCGS